MYFYYRTFLNKIYLLFLTIFNNLSNFTSLHLFNFILLISNIFYFKQERYSNILKKLEKFYYFKNNLYMFYNKTVLDFLFDENYYFYWEDQYTTILYIDKKRLILLDLFKKSANWQAFEQNPFLFYLFDKNSLKYVFFIKTIFYSPFTIESAWNYKERHKNQNNDPNLIALPPFVDDYFSMHNHFKSWLFRYKYFSDSFLNKFVLKIKNTIFIFYFFTFFKNFLIAILISFVFLLYSFFFFKLFALKTFANWIILLLLFFWFFSTFNFFIKRYKFSKYTSAIQRFWKRAFMCFWLIEGFLFAIFFYYLLNASGEPTFMFDTYGLYVKHLLPIKQFLMNSFLIVLIINVFIFLIINIKNTSLKKNIFWLFIISAVLLYLLFVESYQFYYILNFYVEYMWTFSEDDSVWELDYDIPRTRNKNHYITLIVVAKFWHYVFIFISWVFFLMKTLELKRIRYSFLSMNLQNLILFYIMNWLCLYSWFKWFFRRFMDQTYYWFFTSFRPVTLTVIFNDFFNLLNNILFFKIFHIKKRINFNFYYLLTDNYLYGQASFFKKNILLALYI